MVLCHWARWLPCPYMVKHLKTLLSPEPRKLWGWILVCSIRDSKSTVCWNDDTKMTIDLFMVWSNVCPSCCGNIGRRCMAFADMHSWFYQVSESWPMGLLFSLKSAFMLVVVYLDPFFWTFYRLIIHVSYFSLTAFLCQMFYTRRKNTVKIF